MGMLRRMAVGEVAELPLSAYGTARSAASVLKGQYGCEYETHKVGEGVIVRRKL